MLDVIMLMEKFSKHDYSGEAKDLIVLLFVFIKQKTQFDYMILFFLRYIVSLTKTTLLGSNWYCQREQFIYSLKI